MQIDSALINQLLHMKLSAAEWSLYMYLVDLDPFGDRFKDLPKLSDILDQLELSKATFYRTIAKFQCEGLYEFDEKRTRGRNPNGSKAANFEPRSRDQSLTHATSTKEQSHPREKVSHPCDKNSHACDSDSHPRDLNSHARDNQSHPRDNQSPEVLASMDSGSPHKIHTLSHKEQIFSYPLALGSLDEPATADDKRMMAEWVRENYKEWINLAIATRLIKDVGIVYPNNLKRPYFKALEPSKLIDIEKAINEVPLEKLQRWLEEDKRKAQAMGN
ncbi:MULTISPECIES: hypothetical protein [Trichocoleus]|uniref:hypothetical protein n=1 Tax=Trichocoleus TaxID=450526 RepID=UPI0016866662|nr:hypothetical protein [Trichocoleus sp. FACHB-46]MBD1864531.1 hypothetical protein [Trichocoleus sp. FACHB-46]